MTALIALAGLACLVGDAFLFDLGHPLAGLAALGIALVFVGLTSAPTPHKE